MAVSPALVRLLRVRAIEEEQQRLILEAAFSQLHALEAALAAARLRMRQGQALLAQDRASIEIIDRTAALVEIDAARRRAAALRPRIAAAQESANRARQEYLAKRIERRQVQTLIEEARARDAAESLRRTQQLADENFATRRRSRQRETAKREGRS
jgi:hypothetical protein